MTVFGRVEWVSARTAGRLRKVAGRFEAGIRKHHAARLLPRQRGEEMAAMEGVLHGRRVDPRIPNWLAGSMWLDLCEVGSECAHQARVRRAHLVPQRLQRGVGAGHSEAQGILGRARAATMLRICPTLAEGDRAEP